MIYNLVIIFIAHYIGDFILQTRMMGLNKSKSIMWLSMHVGMYLIALFICGFILNNSLVDDNNFQPIFEWCLLNGVLHWNTDFITSKLSSYCYLKMSFYEENANVIPDSISRKHKWQYHFWSVIGLDQLIHVSTLLITYHYFFN